MTTQLTIETERLILRPFIKADAPKVQKLAGEEQVAITTSNIPHPYSDGLAEQWISQHPSQWQARTLCCYAVLMRQKNSLIGAISLMNIVEHCAEMGYWLGIDYWHQGYATEACKAMVDFGFNNLALTQVNAHHLSSNTASGRVLLKVGFSHQCSDTVFWAKTQSDKAIERYQIKL